jgi:hypothetical protein
VQTPQDYREYEGDAYLLACYDAYNYFFASTMPSRHQRNSIIFAGTMGLLRRQVLERLGGWDEWCITEDAELSLRMLKAGYDGVYLPESFGRGVMPLTFASLKSQRFRWCFGGMQILRRHWRDLVPSVRTRRNRLTLAQRVDYLLGSLQWTNDLFYFGFTVVLLATAVTLLITGPVALRPLYGPAILLPSALIVTGVVRALWALRVRTGIGWRRAVFAFLNWLSLSWTVTLACVQGLVRKEGVFLRTPKTAERNRLAAAIWSARTETAIAFALWGLAALLALTQRTGATPFVLGLLAWQGFVYAAAPFMSWLNQHTELSAQLERRRRSEWRRERARTVATPFFAGSLAGVTAGVLLAVIIAAGTSEPGNPGNPFAIPPRDRDDRGPLADLFDGGPSEPSPDESPSTSEPDDGTPGTNPDDEETPSTSPGEEPPSTTAGDGPPPTTVPPTTAPPTTAPPTTAPTSPTATTTP